jgi:D-erythronate 2-dehydrogenase
VPAVDSVLVTGAFGLVGSAVVKQLHADGRRVVATAHHMVNAALADLYGVEVRWVDLTEPAQVNGLLAGVSPSAIVHLAAIIPPQCYAHRALARAVNVDATAVLVRAAAAQRSPPRFVHASSAAVYGARNPHRSSDVLTAEPG